MIILSQTLFDQIKAHAAKDYPHECCGGLLGRTENHAKTVVQVIPLENQWEDSGDETKTRRFRVTGDDYQALEKKATAEGLVLLGFYHSHPDHPPEPSATDLSFAWPVFSYPIITVAQGVPGKMRSYRLDLDHNLLKEEPISISASS